MKPKYGITYKFGNLFSKYIYGYFWYNNSESDKLFILEMNLRYGVGCIKKRTGWKEETM